MKYLKSYKLFESKSNLYYDIKDAFQELLDDYNMEEDNRKRTRLERSKTIKNKKIIIGVE